MSTESPLPLNTPSLLSHLSINPSFPLPTMSITHRLIICFLLGCQILLFTGLILLEFNPITLQDANNTTADVGLPFHVSMKALFFLLGLRFLLLITSIITFLMTPNLRLLQIFPSHLFSLHSLPTGCIYFRNVRLVALSHPRSLLFLQCSYRHQLQCVSRSLSSTVLFRTPSSLLSTLLLQSNLGPSYPPSHIDHRFSNCQLEDISTFRRYTLDPNLASEQIMMHQARSTNRKSFLFVIPSNDPSGSFAHPTFDFIDC